MARGVESAAKATEIAQSALKNDYGFRRPIKAYKTGNTWHVQIDVGVLKTRIATFEIDSTTGHILKYEVSDS